VSADELVDVLDAEGRTVGVVTRREMRARRLPHRSSYVLVFNRAGDLFIHLRVPTKDVYPGHWDVAVGGVLATGESFDDGARREAAEELGVEVGELEHVFGAWMSPGSVTERLHFFAAPYVRGTVADGSRAGLADEGEDIEVLELSFDDALDRIGRDVLDAKTIMLLQWAALRGPFAAARSA